VEGFLISSAAVIFIGIFRNKILELMFFIDFYLPKGKIKKVVIVQNMFK